MLREINISFCFSYANGGNSVSTTVYDYSYNEIAFSTIHISMCDALQCTLRRKMVFAGSLVEGNDHMLKVFFSRWHEFATRVLKWEFIIHRTKFVYRQRPFALDFRSTNFVGVDTWKTLYDLQKKFETFAPSVLFLVPEYISVEVDKFMVFRVHF